MQNYPFNHGLPGPASRPRQVDPTVRALGKPVKPALIITPPYELPSSRSDGPKCSGSSKREELPLREGNQHEI